MENASSEREILTLAAQLQTDRDPAALRQAAQQLGEIGESNSDAIAALTALVRPPVDELVCWQGIRSLGKIGTGNSEAIAVLLEALETARLPSRRLAAQSLVKIASDNAETITAIAKLIQRSSDEFTRQCAAIVLGKLGKNNREASTALCYLLLNSDSREKILLVVGALENIATGTPEEVEALLSAVRKSEEYDDYIRRRALGVLEQVAVGNDKAIAELSELLQQREQSKSGRDIARTLEKIDPKRFPARVVRVFCEWVQLILHVSFIVVSLIVISAIAIALVFCNKVEMLFKPKEKA